MAAAGLEEKAQGIYEKKQEKLPGSCAPRQSHNCPQCGQFQGFSQGVPLEENQAEERSVWDNPYSPKGFEVVVKRKGTFMVKGKQKTTVFFTPSVREKIEDTYRSDNCKSQSEFIEKAVNCYADMLAAGESTTLPRAVQSAIDARLKTFEDRIASLLYKQAVEMDMVTSLVLQSLNVSEEALRQERAKSIAAVKRTNGQLRLEQKLRELESEAWQG